ncbi:MAG: NAD(P)-dependent oxidoreductase, partial [Paracoccaceae bacterium]
MHVLITGAGGHLGRKLFDALEADPDCGVSGIDIRTVDHPNIHTADLSGDTSWVSLLKGVDVIVHLAGDRDPTATWPSAITHNMDATLTLYHHAAAMGVKRVVFASSNWVHGDKRFTKDILNSDTPLGPVNAYGMSKLFGERTGAYFAEHHGLSVICLRIGWTQWTHDNQPGP